MDQMYEMGVSLHSIGVMLLMASILFNLLMLRRAEDSESYKRLRSIFLLPLNSMLIAAIIFTGAIMMAAKHLDFTLENVVMIIVSVLLIAKEVKRSKALKHVDDEEIVDFAVYKQFARKLIYFEIVLVSGVSLWMWLI